MTLRGFGNRVEQALNSVRRGRQYGGSEESGAWPTSRELEPGFASIDPLERGAGVLFASDEMDFLGRGAGADRHDTIPSPPPELESAPWHDESS
ncbi:MAG TPA: hypothetical protein VIV60_13930 [Polyangiaceae bacterium]